MSHIIFPHYMHVLYVLYVLYIMYIMDITIVLYCTVLYGIVYASIKGNLLILKCDSNFN